MRQVTAITEDMLVRYRKGYAAVAAPALSGRESPSVADNEKKRKRDDNADAPDRYQQESTNNDSIVEELRAKQQADAVSSARERYLARKKLTMKS